MLVYTVSMESDLYLLYKTHLKPMFIPRLARPRVISIGICIKSMVSQSQLDDSKHVSTIRQIRQIPKQVLYDIAAYCIA